MRGLSMGKLKTVNLVPFCCAQRFLVEFALIHDLAFTWMNFSVSLRDWLVPSRVSEAEAEPFMDGPLQVASPGTSMCSFSTSVCSPSMTLSKWELLSAAY